MYGLHGKVSLTLLDKNGTVKKTKCKHNTITALGKMAALTNGVANLTDYCNLYGASVAKPHETGDKGMTKASTSVVKIVLTNKQAASFEGKSFESLEDSEIIGFATSATENTGVAKEGIRVSARNEQLDVLVANQTRDGVRFSWTGIEGNLNSVCMFIPPLAIMQCCDNTDTTKAEYTTQFITTGDASVPADCIAIGPSLTKLLNLKTFTISDFIPGTRAVPTSLSGRCAFYFGDYTITFCPFSSMIVTVYNTKTKVYYTVDVSSSISSVLCVAGFIIKNNELYMIGIEYETAYKATAYKVTVTDSEMTFALYSDSTNIINTNWISVQTQYGDTYNTWSFVPVQIGNEVYTYCIDSYYANAESQNDCFIIKDMQAQSQDNKYIAPHVTGAYVYSNITHNVGGVYLNTIYHIDTKGLYVAPVGQYGNLFSYFDLAETWAIASTDTLQLSYFYELEDRL